MDIANREPAKRELCVLVWVCSFWTAWSFMISAQYLEVGPFGGQRLLITVFVLSGLTILAIVISIITESFAYMVTELNTGRTKVRGLMKESDLVCILPALHCGEGWRRL